MGEQEAGRRDENEHGRRFHYARPRRVRSDREREQEMFARDGLARYIEEKEVIT